MGIPRRQRQWEVYRANLGEGPDCLVLVVSSNETNAILGEQVTVCEMVPESLQRLPPSPVTLKARPSETGLKEDATVSVGTLASMPRACLIELEGRLEPFPLQAAVQKGIQVLVGIERWP